MRVYSVILIYILSLLFLSTMMVGCKAVRTVPVQLVKHDTAYIHQVRRDSIVRWDSIHVREKGDTVSVERWKREYIDRWHTDTVYVHRTDSVPCIVRVGEELTPWQEVKIKAGETLLALLLLAVAGLVIVLKIK